MADNPLRLGYRPSLENWKEALDLKFDDLRRRGYEYTLTRMGPGEKQMRALRDAGMEITPQKQRELESQDFYRFSIGKRDSKKTLTIDVAPGIDVGSGYTVEERIPGEAPEVFGAHGGALLGEEGRMDLFHRDPLSAFKAYIESTFEWSTQLGWERDPEKVWPIVKTMGTMDMDLKTRVPGGVQRIGRYHGETAASDITSRYLFGVQEGIWNRDAWNELFQRVKTAGPLDEYYRLGGLIPFKDDEGRMMLRRAGLPSGGGDYDLSIYGLGKDAADIIKRLNIVSGHGIREQVDLMEPYDKGRRLRKAEPQLITGMGRGREGYRLLNMTFSGEQERRAAVIRENVFTTQEVPWSGTMLSYKNVLKGIYSGGFSSQQIVNLPVEDVRELPNAQFEFGIMKPVYEGKGKDRRIVDYKRTGDLAGTYLSKGESAIIGTYTIPTGIPGEEAVKRPIEITAEGPMSFGENIQLFLPAAHRQGKPHPGTVKEEGALPDEVLSLSESYGGATSIRQRMQNVMEAAGGSVAEYPLQGGLQLRFDKFVETGFKMTGAGSKAAEAPAAGLDVITPETRRVRDAGGQAYRYDAILADIKNELMFGKYEFAALPTERQAEMMATFYPRHLSQGVGPEGKKKINLERWIYQQRAETLGTRQEGAFQEEDLAQQWAQYHGLPYEEGRTINTMWEDIGKNLQQLPNQIAFERFGAAFGVQNMVPVQMLTKAGMRGHRGALLRGLALGPEGTGEGGLSGLALRNAARSMMQFEPIQTEQGTNYLQKIRLAGDIRTFASSISPEWLTKQPAFGAEEMMAIEATFPDVAREMGLSSVQGPGATNYTPRHARGWRNVGQVHRYLNDFEQDRGTLIPEDVTRITPKDAERIRSEYLKAREEGRGGLDVLDEIVGGSGMLYFTESEELLERPSDISGITKWEYDDPEMGKAVNKISRLYPGAFWDLLGGASRATVGSDIARMDAERREVFDISKGTALKTFYSRFLQQSIGGRYGWAGGIEPGQILTQKTQMDELLRGLAASGEVRLTRKRRQEWENQMAGAGGLPSVFQRYPVNAAIGGAFGAMAVTPEMATAQTGIQIPKAGGRYGKRLKPGWAGITGLAAQGDFIPTAASGDWDLDPSVMFAAAKVSREGNLAFPEGPDFASVLLKGYGAQVQRLKQLDQVLQEQFGDIAGVPGGQFNILATQYGAMAKAGGVFGGDVQFRKNRGATTVGYEDIFSKALTRMGEQQGMGVNFNLRRLIQSAANVIGSPPEEIMKSHTAKGLGYQRYTDFSVDLETLGGFPSVETLFQTSVLTTNKTGSQAARWVAMPKADQGFTELWRAKQSGDPQDFRGTMTEVLTRALSRDIAGSDPTDPRTRHIQTAAAIRDISMPGDDFEEMERLYNEAPTIQSGLEAITSREGYDILNTPLGFALYGQTLLRTAGWLKRKPREITDVAGETHLVGPAIATQPFPWQGKMSQFQELIRKPEFENLETLYQVATKQAGIITPTQGANLVTLRKNLQEADLGVGQALNMAISQSEAQKDWDAMQRLQSGEPDPRREPEPIPVLEEKTGTWIQGEAQTAQAVRRRRTIRTPPGKTATAQLIRRGQQRAAGADIGPAEREAERKRNIAQRVQQQEGTEEESRGPKKKWSWSIADEAGKNIIEKPQKEGETLSQSARQRWGEFAPGMVSDIKTKTGDIYRLTPDTEELPVHTGTVETTSGEQIQASDIIALRQGNVANDWTQLRVPNETAAVRGPRSVGTVPAPNLADQLPPEPSDPIEAAAARSTPAGRQYQTRQRSVGTVPPGIGRGANQGRRRASTGGGQQPPIPPIPPAGTGGASGGDDGGDDGGGRQDNGEQQMPFWFNPLIQGMGQVFGQAMEHGFKTKVEHFHFGHARNRIQSQMIANRGEIAMAGLKTMQEPYRSFMNYGVEAAGVIQQTLQEAYPEKYAGDQPLQLQHILASTQSITRYASEAMQANPAAFAEFAKRRSVQGRQLERSWNQIMQSYNMYERGLAYPATDTSQQEMKDILEGRAGYIGQGAVMAGALEPVFREKGFRPGKKGLDYTAEELTKLSEATKKVVEAEEALTKKIEEHKDAVGDELIQRKDIVREMQKVKSARAEASLATYEPQLRMAREKLDEDMFQTPDERAQAQMDYRQAAERVATARQQQAMAESEAGEGKLTGMGRLTRRLIGGWGLMYMRSLMGLGTGQFQQGYQEYEQYQQATTMGAIGQVGIGRGITPYPSAEQRYQQAMLQSGGGVFRQLRLLGAETAGTPLSDLAGAALTGVGAYGLGMHVAGSMSGISSLAGFASTLGVAMPAIGLGVAGAAAVGTQLAYAKDQENQRIQAASYAASRGEFNIAGGMNIGWRTLMPSGWQMITQGTPYEETPYYRTFELAEQTRAAYAGGRGVPQGLSNQQLLDLAQSYGMTDFEDLASLDPTLKANLAFTALRYNQQTPGGINITDYVRDVGTAITAGLPVQETAQALYAVSGRGAMSGYQYAPTELQLARMEPGQLTRMQQGLGLMGRTPGLMRELFTQPIEEIQRQAGGAYARIAGGPNEEQFLQRATLAEQRRYYGLDTEVRPEDYARTRRWSMLDQVEFQRQQELQTGGMALQQTMLSRGANLGVATNVTQAFEQSYLGLQYANQALAFNPYRMQEMAAGGYLRGNFQGVAWSDLVSNYDVGLGGELTGLSWGTTSLQRGTGRARRSAEDMATQVWGDRWQGTRWGEAAVNGVTTPSGDIVAGTRGMQWEYTQVQRDYQAAQRFQQQYQMQLQANYQQQSWDIQDRQRALGREQQLWGFDFQQRQFDLTGQQFYENRALQAEGMQLQRAFTRQMWGFQDEQFAMQGRQFQENRGLQARQMQMQRTWTQEDWAFQDMTRGMQWGWKQEDFAEGVRFMSGRQRKLAERQMERETTMYNIEGDRIETQRDRQKEMWALEDDRFELVKEHFDEQRELEKKRMDAVRKNQEETWGLEDKRFELAKQHFEQQRALQAENMAKQKEFYEEGYALQTEAIDAQRKYWQDQYDAQKVVFDLTTQYMKDTQEFQDAMTELSQEQENYTALLQLAQQEAVDMTNAIVDGLNYIVKNAPKALESILSDGKPIPSYSNGGSGGNKIKSKKAMGGDVFPGETVLVGENGVEMLEMGSFGRVINTEQLQSAARMSSGAIRDRWADGVSLIGNSPAQGDGQPAVINIYLGGELLKKIILDTVSQDLEVS